MKDYTQNSYVGQRMALVGIGELNIDQVHASTLLKLDYSVGFEQNVHCSTIEIATLPVTVSNF